MMTPHDIRQELLSVLLAIAPEVEPDELSDEALLRDQVDLDSMDWLNFLVGVHRRFHVEIPEADYQKLRTLADLIRYVQEHAAG